MKKLFGKLRRRLQGIPEISSDGVLVSIIMWILVFISVPLQFTYRAFEYIFITYFLKSKRQVHKKGWFVEFLVLAWTIINIWILQWIANNSTSTSTLCWWFLVIIVGFRTAEFFTLFAVHNLKVGVQHEMRGLARSYFLLFLGFLEIAAISSSFHFIICKDLSLEWFDVFYHSLSNMLTIDSIITKAGSCFKESYLIKSIHIAQPLYTILFVTAAIARMSNSKKKKEIYYGSI